MSKDYLDLFLKLHSEANNENKTIIQMGIAKYKNISLRFLFI